MLQLTTENWKNKEDVSRSSHNERNIFKLPNPSCPLAGRIRYFLNAWEILTSDNFFLGIVQGFRIPFLVEPRQQRVPQTIILNEKETHLVSMEVEEMLKNYYSESQALRK